MTAKPQQTIGLQRYHPRLTRNNFDLLRFLLAMLVCLVHTAIFSGYAPLQWLSQNLSSSAAVKAFFVVSGFLIMMSYERSTSLKSYFSKRIRRIYPAYFVVIMLSAFGLFWVSSKNSTDYFSIDWLRYLAANLSFLNYLQLTLPGVFDANRLNAVNGALWTLKIEVLFYITAPLIAILCRQFTALPVLILFYGLSILYTAFFLSAAQHGDALLNMELSRQLPGQWVYFMSGAFYYYYLPFVEKRIYYFLTGAVLVLLINSINPLPLLEPFAFSTLIIFFGLFGYIGNFGKYGDYSYGVYILHCPIIQLLLLFDGFQTRPWYFLIAVIVLTLVAAIGMWHWVEKRFLLRNSHYQTVSTLV